MAVHTYCSPDVVSWAESDLASLLQGRIFPQNDLTILRKASQVTKRVKEELRVYDLSRAADRLKALKRRVRETPSVVIDGEKFDGFEKSAEAIFNKYGL
jgi:hypothetical protein